MRAKTSVLVVCSLFVFVLVGCRDSEQAARIRKADRLREQKLYDEAIAEYKQVLESNPKAAGAHYGLGSVYLEKGLLAEAEAELRAVLELDTKHAGAQVGLKKLALLSNPAFKCVKFDFPVVDVLDYGTNVGLKVGTRLKAYDSQANYLGEVELTKVETDSASFKKLAPFPQAEFLVHQYPRFFPGEKAKRQVCLSFGRFELWWADKPAQREEVRQELVKLLARKSLLDEFEFVVATPPAARADCWGNLTIEYAEHRGEYGFRLQEPVVEAGAVVMRPVLARTTAIVLRLTLQNKDRKKTTWDRYTLRLAPPRDTSFREGETAAEKERALRAEVFAKLEAAVRPLLPETQ